jgi:phage shock protein A
MPYFSRLTDIITCNITALVAEADDPAAALDEIIREIKEGIAGAERSAKAAANNAARIKAEIAEQDEQVRDWLEMAKRHVSAGEDGKARQALLRKREVEHLVAALQEQLRAAQATCDHLVTTQHALQARLADAQRRLAGLEPAAKERSSGTVSSDIAGASVDSRLREVEAELAQLREQAGR